MATLPIHAALASFGSGVLACAVVHPFDVVKTRIQVARYAKNQFPYQGLTSAGVFRKIYLQEGVRGLYRGLSGSVVAAGASWSSFRFIYDYIRTHHTIGQLNESGEPTFESNLVASTLSGAICTVLVHPLWYIKTRLELQSLEACQKQKPLGWSKQLHQCIHKEGLMSLYRGYIPGLLLVPHGTIQMVLYEEMRRNETPFGPFTWGALSKLFAVLATYPLQVIRARKQLGVPAWTGRGNYSGLIIHLQRACLYNGLAFLLFETFLLI